MKNFKHLLGVLIVSLLVASCSEIPSMGNDLNSNGETSSTRAFKIGYLNGELVKYEEINGFKIMSGDILIRDGELSDSKFQLKYTINRDIRKWPTTNINYI